MKRQIAIAAVVFVLGASLTFAGPAEFSKGNFYLTPQVGFSSWGSGVPIGVNGEYAVTDYIGVGGTIDGQFWSESYWSVSWITVAAQAAYHFIKLNASKVDLYAGAQLGYGAYNVSYGSGYFTGGSGKSGLIFLPLAGVRYYVSPKVALSLRVTWSAVVRTGIGAAVGVTFKLK